MGENTPGTDKQYPWGYGKIKTWTEQTPKQSIKPAENNKSNTKKQIKTKTERHPCRHDTCLSPMRVFFPKVDAPGFRERKTKKYNSNYSTGIRGYRQLK